MKYAGFVALLTVAFLSGCFQREPEGFSADQPVRVGHQRLAIGAYASVGVREDGTVWSWGSSSWGELGRGGMSQTNTPPNKIPGLSGMLEVSGKDGHFVALSSDGYVYSWGNNDRGQLGYETADKIQITPRKIDGLRNIISVSAASSYSVALDRDGNVWGVGAPRGAAMGGKSSRATDPQTGAIEPVKLGTVPGSARIIAGTTLIAVLNLDGQVWLMGSNNRGELGCATTEEKLAAFAKCAGVIASDVTVGVATLYILDRRGFVWASGMNSAGQLGRGYSNHERNATLEKVKGLDRVIRVASNGTGVCALDSNGHIWVWGTSAGGPPPSAGFGATRDWDAPHDIAEVPGAFEIFGGPATRAVALEDGSVSFFGSAAGGIRGASEQLADSKDTWLTPQQSLWRWKAH